MYASILSVRSRMTQQLPKNYSWKLTSTGTKLWEFIDDFSLLAFLSALPLTRRIKREKLTTFPTHPMLEFVLDPQFTLNCESHQLSHD